MSYPVFSQLQKIWDGRRVSPEIYRSRQVTRQMSAIVGLMKLINSTVQLKKQFAFLLEETNKILDVENSIFYLLNDNRGEIWSHFVWNGEGDLIQVRLPQMGGVAEWAIRNERIVNVPGLQNNSKHKKEVSTVGSEPIHSYLIVPIVSLNAKLKGCLQIVNKRDGEYNEEDVEFLLRIGDLISLSLKNLSNKTENSGEDLQLRKEIQRAAAIQQNLMPKCLPDVPGYQLFAYNQPSNFVGGDYYDFFSGSGLSSFVVADVAGSGVPAALLSANLHAYLHANSENMQSGPDMVQKANVHLFNYTEPSMFATFLWGQINNKSHQFKYVNAGHIPPLLLKQNGSVKKLTHGGIPLGILDQFEYGESVENIAPGDVLILVSDGITEAMNSASQQFTLDRLMKLAASSVHLSAQEMGNCILNAVKSFTGGENVSDDMTLVIFKREVTA